MKAIGESCGRTLAQVKAEYKKIGDLGEVAFNSRTRQKTLFKSKPLTVRGVFDELKKVAKTSGKDVRRSVPPPPRRPVSRARDGMLMRVRARGPQSQSRKVGLIKALLAKCEGEETKFLIRSLEGKLRIGLAEKTVRRLFLVPSTLSRAREPVGARRRRRRGRKRPADSNLLACLLALLLSSSSASHPQQALVSLAHAAVTAEHAKSGKKWSREKLSAMLEEGAEVVKSVFSCVGLVTALSCSCALAAQRLTKSSGVLAARSRATTSSCRRCSRRASPTSRRRASSPRVRPPLPLSISPLTRALADALHVTVPQASRSSPCSPSRPRPSRRCSTGSRARTLRASTSTTASAPRSTSSRTAACASSAATART